MNQNKLLTIENRYFQTLNLTFKISYYWIFLKNNEDSEKNYSLTINQNIINIVIIFGIYILFRIVNSSYRTGFIRIGFFRFQFFGRNFLDPTKYL